MNTQREEIRRARHSKGLGDSVPCLGAPLLNIPMCTSTQKLSGHSPYGFLWWFCHIGLIIKSLDIGNCFNLQLQYPRGESGEWERVGLETLTLESHGQFS